MNRKLGILLWGLISGESTDSINYYATAEQPLTETKI